VVAVWLGGGVRQVTIGWYQDSALLEALSEASEGHPLEEGRIYWVLVLAVRPAELPGVEQAGAWGWGGTWSLGLDRLGALEVMA
jgi:hypothetical protein